MFDKYLGLTEEEFESLSKRNAFYQNSMDDVTIEPIKVFSELTEKRKQELLLIREVSKDLQKKKEEDMKKAAQAAEEQKQEQKVEAEATEKTEEEQTQPESDK